MITNNTLCSSVEDAQGWLNSVEFSYGEMAISKYRSQGGQDLIIAIGLKTGHGPEAYRILSAKNTLYVSEVVKEIPDASQLIHQERYLWYDEDHKKYYLVQHENPITVDNPEGGLGEVLFSEITLETVIYTLSGKYYLIIPGKPLESEGSVSKEDFEKFRASIQTKVDAVKAKSLEIKFTSSSDTILRDSSGEVYLEVKIYDDGVDVTDYCFLLINDTQVPKGSLRVSPEKTTTYFLDISYDTYFKHHIKELTIYVTDGVFCEKIPEDLEMTETSVNYLLNYTFSGLSREVGFKDPIIWEGSMNDEKIFCAWPSEKGEISEILDENGINYLSDYEKFPDILYQGRPYRILIKKSGTQMDNFKQKFVICQ